MTNLSPAAQAVLDASMVHSGPAFETIVRRMLADALRTAVHRLNDRRFENGVHWSRMQLLAMADELEGVK
jgi:hypothetical protein